MCIVCEHELLTLTCGSGTCTIFAIESLIPATPTPVPSSHRHAIRHYPNPNNHPQPI